MARFNLFGALVLLGMAAPAVHAQSTFLLQAGAGDGAVQVTVDKRGVFGAFFYDPSGPLGFMRTAMLDTDVYYRIGTTGGRRNFRGPGSAFAGVPLTSCSNTFTEANLSIKLDQSIAPLMVPPGPVQNGAILTQIYTITNTSASMIDLELVRFLHPHLGGTRLGGGRKAGPPESVYLFDKNNSATTLPMELNDAGGAAPATNRYEISDHNGLQRTIATGADLSDSVVSDMNLDGLIDAGKEGHYAMAMRRTFTIAAGANVTYTNTIKFGGGAIVVPVAGVTVLPANGELNVAEGGLGDSYDVSLNAAPTSNVTITVNPDSQIKVSPAVLTFTPANWSTPQTVTVTAVDDAAVEGSHTGSISHSAVSADPAYNAIAIDTLPATIADNDVLPPPPPGEGTYPGSSGTPKWKGEGTYGFGGGMAITAILQTPVPGPQGTWIVVNRPAPATPSEPSSTWFALAGGLTLGGAAAYLLQRMMRSPASGVA